MIERVGREALSEIARYLAAHAPENVILLSDLEEQRARSPTDPSGRLWPDSLSVLGYRLRRPDGVPSPLLAVQGFYRYGRWFPHLAPTSRDVQDAILDALLADARSELVRWVMGVERVVNPLLERAPDLILDYDERDHLCSLDARTFRPRATGDARRATEGDVAGIARLRAAFETEYFGVPPQRVSKAWCLDIARRYIAKGAFVAERDGQIVSMAAVEARARAICQIGAVYTVEAHRSQGHAKRVVSALCLEQFRAAEQITLTVRKDNASALRVYETLGFRPLAAYRIARLR